jgi:hypothetical protein
MPTHNPENEGTKRRYFAYIKEAKRWGEPSLDAAARALNRFEVHTRFRSLSSQAGQRPHERSLEQGHPSLDLAALKAFFLCLASQPDYRPRLSYLAADTWHSSSIWSA